MRTPYSPATRLLSLLELLQSRPRLSAEEVADALQVNPRSARRYITMLQDMGIPVQSRRGRYGGYTLTPGYRLPPLMLTEDEALAITLGLLAAPRLGLVELQTPTAGALAKLERVLPVQTRQRVQAIRSSVAVDMSAASEAPARLEDIAMCSEAARRHLRLRMSYRGRDGALVTRPFDCYGLVHRAGAWYAVGYCHLREALRIFRLDRIADLRLLDESFAPPEGFDCLAYAIASFAAIPDTWLLEVWLDTSFAEACRQIPPDFATLEEQPQGVLLRAYDRSLDHAARFLIGLGRPFRVIAPPELAGALRAIAQDVLDLIDTPNASPQARA